MQTARYVRRVADMMPVTLMTIFAAYSMCVVVLEDVSDLYFEIVYEVRFYTRASLIVVRYNDMVQ